MKNITGVDLNLMTAFEAMMIEQNVTRAAARIGLAQPSMSNALARLRALFDDPLFVRGPAGMQPTERARALAPLIGRALDALRVAMNEGGRFDPLTAEATFRLATTDYGEFIILPELLRRLRVAAPRARLHSLPFDRPNFGQQLERGEVDLALSVIAPKSERLHIAPLFDERFVCIARTGHPAFEVRRDSEPVGTIDLAMFTRLDHALVSRDGTSRGAIDRGLEVLGLERRVVATIANFTTLMFLVAQTDLIAAVGERIAQQMAQLVGVSIHALPVETNGFIQSMAWDRGTEADQGQRWFRQIVRDVCTELC